MVYVGVDIGHSNMGVAVCSAHDGPFEVLFLDKYDLNVYKGPLHTRVNAFFDCVLAPLLEFHRGCTVAIEIQPPTGLVNVEYVLLTRLMGQRVERVHPKSLHVFLNMTHLDYEQRKDHVTRLADGFILNPVMRHKFASMIRKHDVADAILFCHFVRSKEPPEAPIAQLKATAVDLDAFRHTAAWSKH